MKLLLAIAILLPFAAAGEPAFDQTSIRLFEQADGPILPVPRRLYSTRFDATRTRMLGVEVSATYSAPETATTIQLTCTLLRPDGNRSPSERPMSFQFFAGKTESHSANLLWGVVADQDWKPGSYAVECLAGEKSVGNASFEVARNPPEVADGDIRVEAVRVFPVEGKLPPQPLRKYVASFSAAATTRIGVELEFTHAPLARNVKVPVECYFFWPDGQTSPPVILGYEPEPTWAGGFSAGAMGWEQAGNWPKGVYAVSCAIYGQPVAVDRFVVE
jgi:hypothetical protein